MSPVSRCYSLPDRQRGAIGLVSALTLGLALLFTVTVLDSGRLYLEKRSLQRIADMAALEAAGRKGNCSSAASASLYATQSATRNGFTPNTDGRTLSTLCGTLSVNAADGRRSFVANASSTDAIRVVASHPVPASIAAGVASLFGGAAPSAYVQLSATAVATIAPPLARLTLRSALTTIDTSKAALLNPLIGGLLGGTLNLDVASWQGLVDTKLNLLSYLDRLKTDLSITAADYTQVLNTNVSIGQLIQTAINVLQAGNTANASAALSALQTLKIAAGNTIIKLGDVLQIQGGSNITALGADLKIFDLIQSLAQVANKKNGVTANTQVNLAGLAQVKVQLKVIEPPQLSAIGDPSKVNPNVPVASDPNRIYVRTAQTRALISINLPVLSVVSSLATAATNLLAPLTPVLNSALSLNLVSTVSSALCLVGAGCQVTDFQWVSSASGSAGPQIDISLSLGSAESYVSGYTCTSNTSKTLTVKSTTTLVDAKIGQIDSASVFPSSGTPSAVTAQPIPVLDIGTKTCKQVLGIGTCGARTPYAAGGIGLTFESVISQTSATPVTQSFASPNLPELNSVPFYTTPIAILPSSVLDKAISSVKVDVYKPVASNPMGTIITSAASTLGSMTTALDSVVESALKPLLTSVIDPLLASLGISLAPSEVGANLSCNFGQATLVL